MSFRKNDDILTIFRSMPEYTQAKILYFCDFLVKYPAVAALTTLEELEKKGLVPKSEEDEEHFIILPHL